MNKLLVVAFLLCAAPVASVFAADEGAPVSETIAPAPCKKPLLGGHSIRKADDQSEEQDKVDAYQACIQKYAADQQTLAQAHAKAANEAITGFNEFVKAYNDAKNQPN